MLGYLKCRHILKAIWTVIRLIKVVNEEKDGSSKASSDDRKGTRTREAAQSKRDDTSQKNIPLYAYPLCQTQKVANMHLQHDDDLRDDLLPCCRLQP